ncbi:hypothetical protein LCGC14_0559910 [marine sediment metagenome]|uniref:CHAD domain-containing protein n=1 Tax=marine sediment metagenome TaxID=412755 RepID=A0A0F9RSB3_9ZZZZ
MGELEHGFKILKEAKAIRHKIINIIALIEKFNKFGLKKYSNPLESSVKHLRNTLDRLYTFDRIYRTDILKSN